MVLSTESLGISSRDREQADRSTKGMDRVRSNTLQYNTKLMGGTSKALNICRGGIRTRPLVSPYHLVFPNITLSSWGDK